MTKPLLFPLEIYNHPSIRSLNLCQAGLFRLLIESYWKSGIELPKSDYALMRLSNADRRTFAKYKKQVIEALNLTMPSFIEARTARQRNRISFQKNAEKMRVKRKNKGYSKETKFSDQNDTHLEIIPVKISREKWNPGQHDHVARQKAIESNKEGKDVWLRDD